MAVRSMWTRSRTRTCIATAQPCTRHRAGTSIDLGVDAEWPIRAVRSCGIRTSRVAVGRRLASTVADRLPTLLVHRTMNTSPGGPGYAPARGQTRLASTSLQ